MQPRTAFGSGGARGATIPGVRVELTGVVKRYAGAVALGGASLVLRAGAVHAIVGENGAGKSTLLKVAAGVVVADRGSVVVGGAPLSPATPREAIARGVGMLHQHFMLVPTLTGVENLALGAEPTRWWGLLDLAPLRAWARARAASLGMELRLDVPVADLGVGERQRLEIVRVLTRIAAAGAGPGGLAGLAGLAGKVVIFDEPTAVLAPSEAKDVLDLARSLAAQGAAVALVTHHLDEVVSHADEVTVLRRGRVVATHAQGDPAVRDARTLAREALGDAPIVVAARARREPSLTARVARALVLERVSVDARAMGEALYEVSLAVEEGEVVGVAGVEGNGQRALELAIAGMVRAAGRIEMGSTDIASMSIGARRREGLAWIPSDRHAYALAADLPAADVLALGALSEVADPRLGVRWVDERKLRARHAAAVDAVDLRPRDPDLPAGALSGGNQQKLVVARELRDREGGAPRAVLAAHPTRGVDARASALLRALLLDVARRGAAVLVISADLAELRAISDRIVVLRGGRLVAELPPDADVDAIGSAMLGTRGG